ncbi:P1 family peptidase [Luteimonas sp. MJ204]
MPCKPRSWILSSVAVTAVLLAGSAHSGEAAAAGTERPRARDAGVVIGVRPTGPRNAIVDVSGVAVGHATVIEGGDVRTGVSTILPHPGDLYRDRVPAAIVVGNGYGKLIGVTQVEELGELETPILLTGTLGVWRAADALVAWQLAKPGMDEVRSLNPVVGETNDGFLNDIRARPIRPEHVHQALDTASTDNTDEGAIGAGTGTVAFGWKGGIGTSSRKLASSEGGHTVGVLVQSNFGGRLTIDGVALDGMRPDAPAAQGARQAPTDNGDGSIMIVVATDAPLDARLLRRLATRALLGLGRTGGSMSNGSGDYVIAFSTAPGVRKAQGEQRHQVVTLSNDAMTPLFEAVAEATEEAIVNSLFRSDTMSGHRGTVQALPLEGVLPLLVDVDRCAAQCKTRQAMPQ